MSDTKCKDNLQRIKSVIDSIYNGKITVTVGKDDCDSIHKNYDITVILGMIMSHTYEGLGLPIPKTEGGMFL